jgi:hypothetical protein
MKKYLSGLIAIIIAVSLSAFTMNQKHTDKSTITYWWYDADSGDLLNPGGKTDLPGNGCELTGDPVCAYGHETQTGTPSIDPDETAYFVTE